MALLWHTQVCVCSITKKKSLPPSPPRGEGGLLTLQIVMSKESDFQEILENGINFGRGGGPRKEEDKVKTKAKKKKYITGAHGSGSARQKAKYREQRANRHK